jgi:hypothetical protein
MAADLDPIAGIRRSIEDHRTELWPAEQARRLAGVLAEVEVDAALARRLPALAWEQAVAVVNDRLRRERGPRPINPSPVPEPAVKDRVVALLAEWAGELEVA